MSSLPDHLPVVGLHQTGRAATRYPHQTGHNQAILSRELWIRDGLSRIPDKDTTIAPSRIRIPDPGGKKAPDPGSYCT
jgi:hypothetical protein